VPTVLTTKIVVATINMVEIGNSKVSGMPWICSWTHPRGTQRLWHCQYDLGLMELVSPAMMKEC
jgi:hypothetical protein